MSRKETEKLLDDSERLGAITWLVYREKPKGRIMFQQS